MDFVLDCSVTMSWLLKNQTTKYSMDVFEKLTDGKAAQVPAIWSVEVVSILLKCLRRKMVSQKTAEGFIDLLSELSINDTPIICANVFSETLNIGTKHSLSGYDSTYLGLAKKLKIPIATLDKSLAKAAKKEGVGLFLS